MNPQGKKQVNKSVLKKTKEKVNKMYENYGIDPEGMEEDDLEAVYQYYATKQEQLEADLKKSIGHSGKFEEDDII
jgi:hypothetical protein